ncbi:probable glutamate--tRNA ligase, mitochondrial isoform X2 [Venturia canescens]|nr:probable glutamate--tRNA ligase, mitochondrial isoform X2 [Venturia canescens]
MPRRILKIRTLQFFVRRFYKKTAVRVRFAPSPTGYLHLGGLRTALYNYLFARANDGSFILRIEDTDQTRIEPGAMEKLQEDLFWAGIIPDEDPLRGGPAGPYIQSKRLEIYKEQVEKLLVNGSAYYCFCTERRLQMLKKDAIKNGQIPKYDNRCRHLSKEETKSKLANTGNYCIRFKLSSEAQPFHDLIYGEISSTATQQEGDPVIMKADEYPTYHFANVVDDHFMEISHVLRGVEWQISTPKHIQIYEAFGWEPPQFAHLPLILNADGSKLSKRQGDIRVDSYRKQGIFPSALLNFITHAGGGFKRDRGESRCYSYEELIKQFDLNRINTNSTKLAPEKLLEFNKLELGQLLENERNYKFLVDRVTRLVLEKFPIGSNDLSLQLDEAHIISTLKWARNRINKLDDLVTRDLAFLWTVPTNLPIKQDPQCLDTVKLVCEKLDEVEIFEKEYLSNFLREIAKKNGAPFGKFMKVLRALLTGLEEGPAVAEMMAILGREKSLARLKRILL